MGFYPIMLVNGRWIMARQFWLHAQAAESYEKQGVSTSTATSVLRNNNLTISVLDGLVEEQLIEEGAQNEFKNTLQSLRKERLGQFLEKPQIIAEESKRYGLSVGQFEDEILRPQVTKDLLAGRLYLKSIRLEDWLHEQKKKASIKVFSQVFFWDGMEIRTK